MSPEANQLAARHLRQGCGSGPYRQWCQGRVIALLRPHYPFAASTTIPTPDGVAQDLASSAASRVCSACTGIEQLLKSSEGRCHRDREGFELLGSLVVPHDDGRLSPGGSVVEAHKVATEKGGDRDQ